MYANFQTKYIVYIYGNVYLIIYCQGCILTYVEASFSLSIAYYGKFGFIATYIFAIPWAVSIGLIQTIVLTFQIYTISVIKACFHATCTVSIFLNIISPVLTLNIPFPITSFISTAEWKRELTRSYIFFVIIYGRITLK